MYEINTFICDRLHHVAVDAGKSVMLYFAGQVAGNIVSGILSQHMQSRKKAILFFICCSATFVAICLFVPCHSLTVLYIICACLGFGSGYWTLFITVAAELFGSNIRATVATTIPNFVRATVIPLSLLFGFLKTDTGVIYAALIVGLFAYIPAIISLLYLEETFAKEMNYNKE